MRIDWSPYEWCDQRSYHLSSYVAKKGDKVKKGQVICKSGNTGKGTGPHYHLSIVFRKKGDPIDDAHMTFVDPLKVLSGEVRGVYTPLSYWNTNMINTQVRNTMQNLIGHDVSDSQAQYESDRLVNVYKNDIGDWYEAFYNASKEAQTFRIGRVNELVLRQKQQIAELEAQVVKLQTDIIAKDNQILGLQVDLKNANLQVDSLSSQLDQANKDNEELTNKNKVLEIAVVDLKKENEVLTTQIDQQETLIENLNAENARLKEDLATCEAGHTIDPDITFNFLGYVFVINKIKK